MRARDGSLPRGSARGDPRNLPRVRGSHREMFVNVTGKRAVRVTLIISYFIGARAEREINRSPMSQVPRKWLVRRGRTLPRPFTFTVIRVLYAARAGGRKGVCANGHFSGAQTGRLNDR